MRTALIASLALVSAALLCAPATAPAQNAKQGGVAKMTTADFRQKVYDFKAHKSWQYSGKRPCVIDFYATWCGPCRMLAPRLEQLSRDYAGRIDFYKVDVDRENELASLFGINSVPSLLFVPGDGSRPSMVQGALPTEGLKKAFADIFGIKSGQ